MSVPSPFHLMCPLFIHPRCTTSLVPALLLLPHPLSSQPLSSLSPVFLNRWWQGHSRWDLGKVLGMNDGYWWARVSGRQWHDWLRESRRRKWILPHCSSCFFLKATGQLVYLTSKAVTDVCYVVTVLVEAFTYLISPSQSSLMTISPWHQLLSLFYFYTWGNWGSEDFIPHSFIPSRTELIECGQKASLHAGSWG